jgi:ABC-type transport system involved in multi-copper enzyme maturation permease subunit
MIARMARLTRAEFLKLFAHPFLYWALAFLAVSTVSAQILQPWLSGQKETVWRNYHAVQLLAYGFKFGLKLATYVLLIFSAMMFAGEFDRGTIKNLLTRPVTRTEFFAAKTATMAGLSVFLFLFVLYVSLAYALGRGDSGPVWDDTVYHLKRDAGEILGHARKAVFMSFPAFVAAGFLGLLVSTWTESSGYAVAIALVLYLFGDLAGGILGSRIEQKMFFFYGSYGLDKLRLYGEGTNTSWDPGIDERLLWVTVPLGWAAAFLPPAYALFRTRDIRA